MRPHSSTAVSSSRERCQAALIELESALEMNSTEFVRYMRSGMPFVIRGSDHVRRALQSRNAEKEKPNLGLGTCVLGALLANIAHLVLPYDD